MLACLMTGKLDRLRASGTVCVTPYMLACKRADLLARQQARLSDGWRVSKIAVMRASKPAGIQAGFHASWQAGWTA